MHLNHDSVYQAKLIVCVMERGLANKVVETLYQKKHIVLSESLPVRSQGSTFLPNHWVEMDMLKVLVMPQYVDDVFEFIFYEGQVSEIEGSYLFQMDVPWATHFELPTEESLEASSKEVDP